MFVVAAVVLALVALQLSSDGADGARGDAGRRQADLDRDGLPDRWERRHELPTRENSARKDPDGDGLSNRAEYVRGLNPQRADTDRDGLTDRREVTVSGTNPRRRSTVFVDEASVGGPCADRRSASRAASARTPWCSLARAVAAAPDKSAVVVRAGDYPQLAVTGSRRTSRLTLLPYAGERVRLAGIRLEDSAGLRVAGFQIGDRSILEGDSERIDLVGNDISPQGISLRGGVHDVRIVGNRIHDLTYEGPSWGAGYGLWMGGEPLIRNIAIRRNRFERIPADGIQMGGVEGVLIEDNEITGVQPYLDPTEHSDAVQMYGTAGNVTLRSNVIRNNAHTLIAKGFTYPGLRIENNLVSDTASGLNIYDAPGVRIVNNTIWRTVSFALRFASLKGQTRDAVVANNIFDIFWFGPGDVAFEGHNLVAKPARGTAYSRTDLLGVSPIFASRTSLADGLVRRSPGVDDAARTYAPPRDRLGRRRVGRPDIGAQESR